MARSHLFGAVRHPREPKVLLLRTDRAWRLPHAVVDNATEANARRVVSALGRRLDAPLWLLRSLDRIEDEASEGAASVDELELLDADWEAPAHGRWVGHAELGRLRLKDERQRPLLAAYLEALERRDVPDERPPWARPGWHADVTTWVEHEVARLGHVVRGIEQVKQWSISSVLRIETDGPDVYFKVAARLPLFVDEAAVTVKLAERFPEHVPAPLAVEPARGWMLLPAFDELFPWYAALDVREEALRRFAGLQRRTVQLADDLLADGCLDRRLDVLKAQIDPLLNDPEAVARLTDEEVTELRRLAPLFQELCSRLARFSFPPTLVHGDLHLGNVTRLGRGLAYFDWTDACVAHPFTDLHTLSWEKDEESRAALLAAYLEPWDGVESPERTQEALGVASVVVPLHHAVSYRHIVAGLEPAAKPELDATHHFLRQALAASGPLLGGAVESAAWPGTS